MNADRKIRNNPAFYDTKKEGLTTKITREKGTTNLALRALCVSFPDAYTPAKKVGQIQRLALWFFSHENFGMAFYNAIAHFADLLVVQMGYYSAERRN